ncbi:MAG: single-stranded DNA-binding protein [Solobacterium sp.]|nr:single-stranded DNA-binding protein [Solobacterium sp.]
MATVNSVVLLGRLTKDPELRKTSSGTSFCRFTVACDKRKTKDDQESGANFISCVAWRQNADFISDYGQKGNQVTVEGSIETGSYTDRDGRKVYTTEVLVNRVQLADTKQAKSDYPNNGTSYTMAEAAAHANEGFDVGDADADISGDDLPF